MKILIINGPNLNLLGVREREIYGDLSFEEYFDELKDAYFDIELTYFQSNHEGEIIDKLQKKGFDSDGIIINAGALTHTSIAIRDAIKSIKTPVVEVHISNIFAREDFRQNSYLAGVCKGIISGFGLESYALAIDSFIDMGGEE
jgi:3-dehydroquinate dehydratase II